VVSPGFTLTHPLVAWCTSVGVPVWASRTGLRLRDCSGRVAEWIAITGTNVERPPPHSLPPQCGVAGGKRDDRLAVMSACRCSTVRDPIGFWMPVVELSFQLHYLKSMSALVGHPHPTQPVASG
jgi:UDP-N-acetylmuramoylalanine--D-glutamate ligase